MYVTSGVVGYLNRFLPIGRILQGRGQRVVVISADRAALAVAGAEGLDTVHLPGQMGAFAALPEPASWSAPLGRVLRFVPGVALGPRATARHHWRARAAAMLDTTELTDALLRLEPRLVLTEAEEHRDIRVVLGHRLPLLLFEDLYAVRPDRDVPFPARSHHIPDGSITSRWRAALRWQRFFAVEALRRRAERWWLDDADWHSTLARLSEPAVLAEAGVSRRYLQFYDYRRVPHVRTVAPELAFPGEAQPATVTGPVVDVGRRPVGVDAGFAERWTEIRRRRAAGGRVLYLTLGTFLSGLEDLTAIVIEAAGGVADLDVVASVGADLPRWRDRPLPPNVAVFARVPQLEVLEGSDVVVSTGGLNTGHEALWFGVPVLNLPVGGVDTAGNAARLAHHGVGRRLRPREISVGRVRQELCALLDDPRYRRRAGVLSQRLRAWDGAARAADAIEAAAGRT